VKTKIQSSELYSFFILFLCSLFVNNNVKGEDIVSLYKCEFKKVSVSNVSLSPTQKVFDENGGIVSNLDKASTYMIFASDRMNPDKIDYYRLVELFKNRSSWKPITKKLTDGLIVGLAVDSDDFLIYLEGKWWLIRIYPENIGMVAIKLIFEKDDVKIGCMELGAKILLSYDTEFIRVLSKITKK
jgi:hypothetical protein